MKRTVLTALAVALLGAGHATAQKAQFASIEATDPISVMEASLSRARAEIQEEVEPGPSMEAVPNEAGTGYCDNCQSCGCQECACQACDPCEDVCDFDCCQKRHHLSFGVEATYLVPVFSGSRVVDFFRDSIEPMNFNSLDNHELVDYDFEAAPRIWLGIEGDCWGIRSRYWQFDAEAATVGSLSFNQTTDVISFHRADANMEAYTIDLEATKRKSHGCWDLLLAGGVRHASIFNGVTFNSMLFDNDDGGIAAFADVDQRFDGTGLTFAVEGRRPLGCTRLSLLWNARGSVLWGHTKTGVEGARSNLDFDDVDTSITGTVARERFHDTLGIGELQAGLEWAQPLESCAGGNVFARAMFEGQWWGHDQGSALMDEVDFYGVTFAVGFSR